MNRLHLREQNSQSLSSTASSSLPNPLLPAKTAREREANFLVPLHYERNYAYPLLIWLHEGDHGAHQLKQVMPHISLRNYVGASPGGGLVVSADTTPSDHGRWPRQESGIADTLERVEECMQLAQQRFHIHPSRIFLAGYDRGGMMALRLGVAAPELFAGVASLGGAFPRGQNPMAQLHRLRHLPVMIAHGRESQAYPVRRLCDDLRLFHAAGMSLNLRQYPCGDELTTQMLIDLNVWIMGLVTGVDTSSGSTSDQRLYDSRN